MSPESRSRTFATRHKSPQWRLARLVAAAAAAVALMFGAAPVAAQVSPPTIAPYDTDGFPCPADDGQYDGRTVCDLVITPPTGVTVTVSVSIRVGTTWQAVTCTDTPTGWPSGADRYCLHGSTGNEEFVMQTVTNQDDTITAWLYRDAAWNAVRVSAVSTGSTVTVTHTVQFVTPGSLEPEPVTPDPVDPDPPVQPIVVPPPYGCESWAEFHTSGMAGASCWDPWHEENPNPVPTVAELERLNPPGLDDNGDPLPDGAQVGGPEYTSCGELFAATDAWGCFIEDGAAYGWEN